MVLRTCRIWYTEHFQSPDRVTRHFAYLQSFILCLTATFIALNPVGAFGAFGAPLCTLWGVLSVCLTLAHVHALEHHTHVTGRWIEWIRFGLFLVFGLSVLIFFDGSNIVNRARYAQLGNDMLYDQQLLAMDDALLGWLWPKGQLALALDTNPLIGPSTLVGRVYAEFLQIMYASYYGWGNGLLAFLAFQYFTNYGAAAAEQHAGAGTASGDSVRLLAGSDAADAEGGGEPISPAARKISTAAHRALRWRRVMQYLSAWVMTFLLNFVGNLLVPAVSPRIYMAASYVEPITGFYITSVIRGAITKAAANTFSAFPSGHCGLSWLTVVLARRSGYHTYAKVSGAAAVAITTATLVLRYHYFVDFVFALPLVAFGGWCFGDAETLAAPLPAIAVGASPATAARGLNDPSDAGAVSSPVGGGVTVAPRHHTYEPLSPTDRVI